MSTNVNIALKQVIRFTVCRDTERLYRHMIEYQKSIKETKMLIQEKVINFLIIGLLLLLLKRPFGEAKKEFEECLKIDKDNQIAQTSLNSINLKIKQC